MTTEKVNLGSGELYIVEYAGTIPADATFELAANKIGQIKGGASLEYKPTDYAVTNDKSEVLKRFITNEDVTFKSGILTWDVETLSKLCAAGEFTNDTVNNKMTLKIGGRGRNGITQYAIRFVHELGETLKLRVTLVGTQSAGFTLAFQPDKETVVDAEFKAMAHDSEGTLVIIEQDTAAVAG